jgi:hypothetical protein
MYLGGYVLACFTLGCVTTATGISGLAAGTSASATTLGAGSFLYFRRYRNWSIKEVGKYIVTDGKL